MWITDRVLRGGIHLSAGEVIVQVCSFARNVIVARLVSPADFGIASLLAMSLSFVEMISNLAVEKLLIQAADGDSESFQGTIQFAQFVRGCLTGLVLFYLAGPLAGLFGVEEAEWAFRWLGFVPFLRGLVHLDMIRLHRQMRFGRSIVVESGVAVITTAAAYPLGKWLGDYSTMLWMMLASAAMTTVSSHIVSVRRYRWSFEKETASQLMSFGLPLLINGLLMFGVFQGDRFVIGAADRIFGTETYTLTDLGVYSVAFSLTFAPTMLIANIGTKLFLPILSRAQDSRDLFLRRYSFVCRIIPLAGGLCTIPLVVSGNWIMVMVFGPQYGNAGAVVTWLAAMQALRIMRIVPTMAAMSLGDTKNGMFSNMVRSFAFAGTVATAAVGGPLSAIAVFGFVGEMLAMGFGVRRLRVTHGVPMGLCLRPAAMAGTIMMLGSVTAVGFVGGGALLLNLLTCAVTMLCFLWGMFRTSNDLWFELSSRFLVLRKGGDG